MANGNQQPFRNFFRNFGQNVGNAFQNFPAASTFLTGSALGGLGGFGFGGPFTSFISSPIGGLFSNYLAGKRFQNQLQDLQGQIDFSNQQGQNILGQLGGLPNVQQQAGQLNQQVGQIANNAFSPNSIAGFLGLFNPSLQGLQQLPGQIGSQVGGATQAFQQGASQLGGQFLQGAGVLSNQLGQVGRQVTQGLESQADRARGIVSQIGQQQREDINRGFNELAAQKQSDLQSRGLRGTTLTTNVARGVESDRLAEQRRLSEQIAGQRLGVESTFGAAPLAAQERFGLASSNLGQNLLFGGSQLRQGLMSNLLAGRLQGAGLQAQTGLGALGQQANIAGQQFQGFQQGALNQISSLLAGGQLPISTALQTAGLGLGFFGPFTTLGPGQFQPAQTFPPVRF